MKFVLYIYIIIYKYIILYKMENVKNAANNLKNNIADNLNNIKDNIVNVGNNIKENLPAAPGMPDLKPDSGDSFFQNQKRIFIFQYVNSKSYFFIIYNNSI